VDMIKSLRDLANVSLSRSELLVLNAALNEVCNGSDVSEFETRIGADREFVTGLLHEIGSALDDMDHLSD
jgi:hypothetical protein